MPLIKQLLVSVCSFNNQSLWYGYVVLFRAEMDLAACHTSCFTTVYHDCNQLSIIFAAIQPMHTHTSDCTHTLSCQQIPM